MLLLLLDVPFILYIKDGPFGRVTSIVPVGMAHVGWVMITVGAKGLGLIVTAKLFSAKQFGVVPVSAYTKIVWLLLMTVPAAIGPTPPVELKYPPLDNPGKV
jgi:hypothetical protein